MFSDESQLVSRSNWVQLKDFHANSGADVDFGLLVTNGYPRILEP